MIEHLWLNNNMPEKMHDIFSAFPISQLFVKLENHFEKKPFSKPDNALKQF